MLLLARIESDEEISRFRLFLLLLLLLCEVLAQSVEFRPVQRLQFTLTDAVEFLIIASVKNRVRRVGKEDWVVYLIRSMIC